MYMFVPASVGGLTGVTKSEIARSPCYISSNKLCI